MATTTETTDVVVIGAGNAALSAALEAKESGAEVLVLEAAPIDRRGGNTFFAGGAVRFVINDKEDVRGLVPELTDADMENIEIPAYTLERYYNELAELSGYQADPELAYTLVSNSREAMEWLAQHGVRYELAYGRHALRDGTKFRFYGDVPVEWWGGGRGLIESMYVICEKAGIEVRYESRAFSLEMSTPNSPGIKVNYHHQSEQHAVRAGGVVIACGGFEANPQMRAQHLGPGWDLARVRGTEFNVGDGIRMALEVGAHPVGHWSGCHAVAWDMNAPWTGDRKVGDMFQKHSYPFGVVVNKEGRRFIDEGADFQTHTYAKYGKEILYQPGRVAYQIFDKKVMHLLRSEYEQPGAAKVRADTIEELAAGFEIDPAALVKTIEEYNAAVQEGTYDPATHDGKGTVGIEPPKSNWALKIDEPPFVAYGVTCGITFTFGGLAVSPSAEVIDLSGTPIPGLYAAGEIVGRLYYENYPTGAGLVAGTVYGRLAGRGAASFNANGPKLEEGS